MNAYELADKLQMDKAKALLYVDTVVQSAEMLRQQADRIAEFEKLEQDFIRVIKQTNPNKPQTKPLSDEEIFKLGSKLRISTTEIEYNWHPVVLEFARAIEERHGIK